jgi:hypothetical protein
MHNPYSPPTAPVEDAPIGAVSANQPALNPWFSMWTRPRATIAQIVERDASRLVVPLAAIAGFGQALDRASTRSAGDTLDLPTIFLVAAVAGPVGGIITLYLAGVLLRWTGSWLGGKASTEHIRAAIAWSNVPTVWALLLWIPELAIFGGEMFTTETPRLDANVGLAFLLLFLIAVEVAIGLWAFVVFLKSLGQVQGFSAWKALGNGLLALLSIVVPIVLLAVGMATFRGASLMS